MRSFDVGRSLAVIVLAIAGHVGAAGNVVLVGFKPIQAPAERDFGSFTGPDFLIRDKRTILKLTIASTLPNEEEVDVFVADTASALVREVETGSVSGCSPGPWGEDCVSVRAAGTIGGRLTVVPGEHDYFWPPPGRELLPSASPITVTVACPPGTPPSQCPGPRTVLGWAPHVTISRRVPAPEPLETSLVRSFHVKDTKEFRVLYVPLVSPDQNDWDCGPDDRLGPQTIVGMARIAQPFLSEVFPLAEFKPVTDTDATLPEPAGHFQRSLSLRHEVRCIPVQVAHDDICSSALEVLDALRFDAFDMVVGVVPRAVLPGSAVGCARHGIGTRAINVRLFQNGEEDARTTVAHEMAHTLGWVSRDVPLDITGCSDLREGHFCVPVAVDGYSVLGRAHVNGLEIMQTNISNALRHWVGELTEDYLFEQFRRGPDPIVVHLRAQRTAAGLVEVPPWYKFASEADPPIGSSTDPADVLWLTFVSEGRVVGESGVAFPEARVLSSGSASQAEVTAPGRVLSTRLPSVAGADRVIATLGSETIFERRISRHAPQIRLLTPVAGQTLHPREVVRASWEATDPDVGDVLNFAVFIRRGPEAPWIPIAVDVSEQQLSFAVPDDFAVSAADLRVMATDGVNTAEASTSNSQPTVQCPGDVDLQCGAGPGTAASVHAVVEDEDGDALRATWQVDGVGHGTEDLSGTAGPLSQSLAFTYTYTPGVHVVDLVVTDGKANPIDCGFVVNCNRPPDCSAAVASPATLMRPNHKFVKVKIQGITDADGDAVTIGVTGIAQDDPLDSYGDGHTCPGGSGVGSDTALVRAERARSSLNSRDGRVYHVRLTADDGHGGRCSGTVAVCVPTNRRPNATCVDGGPLFDSTGPCS